MLPSRPVLAMLTDFPWGCAAGGNRIVQSSSEYNGSVHFKDLFHLMINTRQNLQQSSFYLHASFEVLVDKVLNILSDILIDQTVEVKVERVVDSKSEVWEARENLIQAIESFLVIVRLVKKIMELINRVGQSQQNVEWRNEDQNASYPDFIDQFWDLPWQSLFCPFGDIFWNGIYFPFSLFEELLLLGCKFWWLCISFSELQLAQSPNHDDVHHENCQGWQNLHSDHEEIGVRYPGWTVPGDVPVVDIWCRIQIVYLN